MLSNSYRTKADIKGSNCEASTVGGCAGSRYGCCMDGRNVKLNAYGTNCPENQT